MISDLSESSLQAEGTCQVQVLTEQKIEMKKLLSKGRVAMCCFWRGKEWPQKGRKGQGKNKEQTIIHV